MRFLLSNHSAGHPQQLLINLPRLPGNRLFIFSDLTTAFFDELEVEVIHFVGGVVESQRGEDGFVEERLVEAVVESESLEAGEELAAFEFFADEVEGQFCVVGRVDDGALGGFWVHI